MDRGDWVRIRHLSPDSTEEELTRNYTWRQTNQGKRHGRKQPTAVPAVKAMYGLDGRAEGEGPSQLYDGLKSRHNSTMGSDEGALKAKL